MPTLLPSSCMLTATVGHIRRDSTHVYLPVTGRASCYPLRELYASVAGEVLWEVGLLVSVSAWQQTRCQNRHHAECIKAFYFKRYKSLSYCRQNARKHVHLVVQTHILCMCQMSYTNRTTLSSVIWKFSKLILQEWAAPSVYASTAAAVSFLSNEFCRTIDYFRKNSQRCRWFLLVSLSYFLVCMWRFSDNNPVQTCSWQGRSASYFLETNSFVIRWPYCP